MRKIGKKGFVAESLVDFYSYFAYILIIMVFILLFSLQSCEGKIEQKLEDKFTQNQAEVDLINFLRTPLPDNTEALVVDLAAGAKWAGVEKTLVEHPELYKGKNYAEFLQILYYIYPKEGYTTRERVFRSVSHSLFSSVSPLSIRVKFPTGGPHHDVYIRPIAKAEPQIPLNDLVLRSETIIPLMEGQEIQISLYTQDE